MKLFPLFLVESVLAGGGHDDGHVEHQAEIIDAYLKAERSGQDIRTNNCDVNELPTHAIDRRG